MHGENLAGSAAGGSARMKSDTDIIPSDQLLALVLSSLDDDKAEDVVTIDLRGRSSIADYMVICSGRSSRQVASISEKLIERLKAEFRLSSRVEGKEQGDWVLIDAGEVVVHVFRPEVRDFYQLEKMWMPAGARSGEPTPRRN
ncbi:ribosome-associated protein [Albidovulum inexpectatum]|uniref:Ribosomal silencing factor RsfS n=2 Tax=Albidovulum inexpectatum TaxID=196587 RepID=A0A2S5JM00_9RHOB|nr:ribosome-associated protein [Albidovulum inexpectatum]